MADDADAGAAGPSRRVLRHGREIAPIPRITQHPGKDVAFALHDPKRASELGLDHQEALVLNPRVDRFLDQGCGRAFALLDHLGDWVADLPDHPLAAGQPGMQTAGRPLLVYMTK